MTFHWNPDWFMGILILAKKITIPIYLASVSSLHIKQATRDVKVHKLNRCEGLRLFYGTSLNMDFTHKRAAGEGEARGVFLHHICRLNHHVLHLGGKPMVLLAISFSYKKGQHKMESPDCIFQFLEDTSKKPTNIPYTCISTHVQVVCSSTQQQSITHLCWSMFCGKEDPKMWSPVSLRCCFL